MVHSHCPQDPWAAEQHRETTRGCDSHLDRFHPTWEGKNRVWGQNLVLGGVNLQGECHGASSVPSLCKNISFFFLLSMHAAAVREMGELSPLFMLPATNSYAHLPLTASGLYVLLFMTITLALEMQGEHLCTRWEWFLLRGLFFDEETLTPLCKVLC